ncbi:hypothetical protein KIH39_02505 [Telmatocola sphagniphila]|uniref:Prenyltransferase n=1 Tax=Telmatocola sphagniphila TaxID=1123043 RepID=A0A8E6B9E6_9BACT|nr:hypothetical protein [Telmatocola sphagniphila]QVL32810.1 hypothetical protein KIH39_02505 [Telmatocola sphagniphila]
MSSELPEWPWWIWPHLLSLDAPIIAVIWQSFFCYIFHVPLPALESIVLGLIVWGIYLADHWLDTRKHSRTVWQDRHKFAARYSKAFLCGALLSLTMGAFLSLWLPERTRLSGGILGLLVALYFVAVHGSRMLSKTAVKELSVALLFAAGVSVSLIAEENIPFPESTAAVVGFGSVCFVNCLMITLWENSERKMARISLALAFIPVALSAVFSPAPFGGCFLLSYACLGILHLFHSRLSLRVLRVLADVSLLSPLFVRCLL